MRDRLGRRLGLVLIALPILLGLVAVSHTNPENEQLKRAIKAGHETRDLPARGIAAFGIAFLVVMALVLVVATGTEFGFARQLSLHLPQNLQSAPIPTLPPEPQLEAVPGQQMQNLRAAEEKLLNSYGWVDKNAGITHIPIDRAMDLILQRGLPSRPANQSNFQDQGGSSPSYPSSGQQQESYP